MGAWGQGVAARKGWNEGENSAQPRSGALIRSLPPLTQNPPAAAAAGLPRSHPQERQALEAMRQEFESELQAARSEVAKAQSALVGAEERVRSAEQVERARLEAGYQARVTALQAEVERMRQELAYRTSVMQSEMQRCVRRLAAFVVVVAFLPVWEGFGAGFWEGFRSE